MHGMPNKLLVDSIVHRIQNPKEMGMQFNGIVSALLACVQLKAGACILCLCFEESSYRVQSVSILSSTHCSEKLASQSMVDQTSVNSFNQSLLHFWFQAMKIPVSTCLWNIYTMHRSIDHPSFSSPLKNTKVASRQAGCSGGNSCVHQSRCGGHTQPPFGLPPSIRVIWAQRTPIGDVALSGRVNALSRRYTTRRPNRTRG